MGFFFSWGTFGFRYYCDLHNLLWSKSLLHEDAPWQGQFWKWKEQQHFQGVGLRWGALWKSGEIYEPDKTSLWVETYSHLLHAWPFQLNSTCGCCLVWKENLKWLIGTVFIRQMCWELLCSVWKAARKSLHHGTISALALHTHKGKKREIFLSTWGSCQHLHFKKMSERVENCFQSLVKV